MTEHDRQPADLAAVAADDALLDALGARPEPRPAPGGPDPLTDLLGAWRAELDAAALPVDDAVLLAAVPAPRRRRGLRLAPLGAAAAAASVVLALGAVGARDAAPGDPLWGVTQVVFTEHARSVTAAADADLALTEAARALEAGRPAEAGQALARAEQSLGRVTEAEGSAGLRTRLDDLTRAWGADAAVPVPRPGTPVATVPAAPSSPAVTPAPPRPTGTPVAPPPAAPSRRPTTPAPTRTTAPDPAAPSTSVPAPTTTPPAPTTPTPVEGGSAVAPTPTTSPAEPATP